MSDSTLPIGIDVSNHQGHIDWASVAASGIEFAIIKASEGTWYRDPYFPANWAGAKDHGIRRGAYHFMRPDRCKEIDEAVYFYSVVEEQGIDTGDFLDIDVEDDPNHCLAVAQSHGISIPEYTSNLCLDISDEAGFDPLIYTARNVINQYGFASHPELGKYGLWLASWGSQFPTPPDPWELVAFWQYSASGSVPGISGDVDMNRFNGPVEVIDRYGKRPDLYVPEEPAIIIPVPPTGDVAALVMNKIVEIERIVADIKDIVGKAG